MRAYTLTIQIQQIDTITTISNYVNNTPTLNIHTMYYRYMHTLSHYRLTIFSSPVLQAIPIAPCAMAGSISSDGVDNDEDGEDDDDMEEGDEFSAFRGLLCIVWC